MTEKENECRNEEERKAYYNNYIPGRLKDCREKQERKRLLMIRRSCSV